MNPFHVIIPARFASTRLPEKMLVDIAGKPMLQHVYECALKSGATQVVIATDDERIEKAAKKFGAKVCMTSINCMSGTERLAETAKLLKLKDNDIVVNVQGDEPLMPFEPIRQVAQNLAAREAADVATLYCKIQDSEELFNPGMVKVVMDKNGYALYFSRAPIAWDRDGFAKDKSIFSAHAQYYRHIGLYAYRVSTLQKYVAWESSYLEKIESLEQLRVLWHGGKIHVAESVEPVPPGVDTAADLAHIRKIFSSIS